MMSLVHGAWYFPSARAIVCKNESIWHLASSDSARALYQL